MKKFKKIHENTKAANSHVKKIQERGGTIINRINNKNKITLEYAFSLTLYRGDVYDKGINFRIMSDYMFDEDKNQGFYFFTDSKKEAIKYATEFMNPNRKIKGKKKPNLTVINAEVNNMLDLSELGGHANTMDTYQFLSKIYGKKLPYSLSKKLGFLGSYKTINDGVYINGKLNKPLSDIAKKEARQRWEMIQNNKEKMLGTHNPVRLSNDIEGKFFIDFLKKINKKGYIFIDSATTNNSKHYGFIDKTEFRITDKKYIDSSN